MMKAFAKISAPAAAVAAVVALGAMSENKASAGEFCRQDVTGHMTGCGFDSMEQCKAASAGIGGDCFRDPFSQGQPRGLRLSSKLVPLEERRPSARQRSKHQTIRERRVASAQGGLDEPKA
jgi:hypothetical protein